VNAHVHLELSGEPDTMGAVVESTSNQRLLRAVENARKTLAAGVTTVRDVGSSNAIAADVRDAIEAGRIPGPRMRASGAVLCMTGGHGWPFGRAIDSPWDARKAVREQLWAGADCIKLIATGGVLTKGAVPGNAQLTPDELAAAVDEAHRHGLRVAAHAIGTLGIKNALRAGVDSIEHGHMLDDEAIALFKAAATYLVPTLAAPTCILAHVGDGRQPQFATDKARVVNAEMLVNIRRAYAEGVRIAGGSDAGTPYNFHEDYAYEVELMSTLLGMTPQQALHAATAVAAELIGLHRGILAAGEPADLLLLDRDAGVDPRALRDPRCVVKGGIVV
jgi:imidazolonepropionase-like amidohydrolase